MYFENKKQDIMCYCFLFHFIFWFYYHYVVLCVLTPLILNEYCILYCIRLTGSFSTDTLGRNGLEL